MRGVQFPELIKAERMLLLSPPGCICPHGWHSRGSGLAGRGNGGARRMSYFIQLQIHACFICLNQIQPFDFRLEDLRTEQGQVSLCPDLERDNYFMLLTLPCGQAAGGTVRRLVLTSSGNWRGATQEQGWANPWKGCQPKRKEAQTRAGWHFTSLDA